VTKQRKILVGIFLLDDRKNPVYRMIYDDWESARRDTEIWMMKGFVNIGLPDSVQDHYAPSQIFKVRFRPVIKVITASRPTGIPFPETEEIAHFEDEAGTRIDVWTDSM
jgi:hypothetical protein